MCWHLLDCGGPVFLGLLASKLKLSSIWAKIQNLNPIYLTVRGPCRGWRPLNPNIPVVDLSFFWFFTKSMCKWGQRFQAPSLLLQSILWMHIGLILLSLYWLFFCVFTALTGAATRPDHVQPCHESIPRLSRRQHTETTGILGLWISRCRVGVSDEINFFFLRKNKCSITRFSKIMMRGLFLCSLGYITRHLDSWRSPKIKEITGLPQS